MKFKRIRILADWIIGTQAQNDEPDEPPVSKESSGAPEEPPYHSKDALVHGAVAYKYVEPVLPKLAHPG